MGNRLAKPPPLDRPIAPPRGRNAALARPFPALTPQSYLPGSAAGAGIYPGLPVGGAGFPPLNANAFLPPSGGLEPPIMNFSGAPGMFQPPAMPSVFPPSILPSPGFPPPGSFAPANPSLMSVGPPAALYESGLRSYPRGRPVRICRRRRRHRSRHCRPVVRVVESSSCSSLSTCSTRSSCSRHRRRRSHSCRRSAAPQQQQPIILLPVPSQQPVAAPVQNAIQQQPQQVILPPIQVQQPGQLQPQQLALPPISLQQLGSSNLVQGGNSNPFILTNGQSLLQPSLSLPQIANIRQGQPMQPMPVQIVQSGPQISASSSPLQYVTSEPRSTVAQQRVLVNSTNKKPSKKSKAVARSASTRHITQNDLKFGRRPFDWYEDKKKNDVVNENIQVGQRGNNFVG